MGMELGGDEKLLAKMDGLKGGCLSLNISMNRQADPVEYMVMVPDMDWAEIADGKDGKQHFHMWNKDCSGITNCEKKVERHAYWDWDDFIEYDEIIYVCRLCHKKVDPKYVTKHESALMVGLISWEGTMVFADKLPRAVRPGKVFRIDRFCSNLIGRAICTGYFPSDDGHSDSGHITVDFQGVGELEYITGAAK